MITAILTAVRAYFASNLMTVIIYGAAAAAAGGAVTYWSVHEYNKGWNAHAREVAAQDKEAVDAVNNAVGRLRECRSSGGVWSQASGECQRR